MLGNVPFLPFGPSFAQARDLIERADHQYRPEPDLLIQAFEAFILLLQQTRHESAARDAENGADVSWLTQRLLINAKKHGVWRDSVPRRLKTLWGMAFKELERLDPDAARRVWEYAPHVLRQPVLKRLHENPFGLSRLDRAERRMLFNALAAPDVLSGERKTWEQLEVFSQIAQFISPDDLDLHDAVAQNLVMHYSNRILERRADGKRGFFELDTSKDVKIAFAHDVIQTAGKTYGLSNPYMLYEGKQADKWDVGSARHKSYPRLVTASHVQDFESGWSEFVLDRIDALSCADILAVLFHETIHRHQDFRYRKSTHYAPNPPKKLEEADIPPVLINGVQTAFLSNHDTAVKLFGDAIGFERYALTKPEREARYGQHILGFFMLSLLEGDGIAARQAEGERKRAMETVVPDREGKEAQAVLEGWQAFLNAATYISRADPVPPAPLKNVMDFPSPCR